MLKLIQLTIITLSTLFTSVLYAQENDKLFSYADEQRSSLSTTTGELLTAIEGKVHIKSVKLIETGNLQSLISNELISLEMPDGNILSFKNSFMKLMRSGYQYWTGYDEKNKVNLSMVVNGNEVTGMIRAEDSMFDINPLRNTSLHTLQEINASKLEKESTPIEVQENVNKRKVIKNKSVTPTINILVAYTTAAKNNHSGNIESSIVLAEGNLDNSFSNSDITADVDVVHTMEVSYSESSTSLLNLCRLTTSMSYTPGGDCNIYSNLQDYMDIIHQKRYDYNAHVVVLITDDGGPGIGWLKSNKNTAFSVVREDRFVSTHTMAHEIGHNIGAQHNNSQDTNPYYSYGHGYNYNPSNWSTIMAYPPSGSIRINHFSNPDKTFAGVATGTSTDEDNARVWDNRAGIVANFNPPAPPLSVSISGAQNVVTPQSVTYTATASYGATPYQSYMWYKKDTGSSSWTYLGSSSSNSKSIYFSNPANDTQLKVTVEDANLEYATSIPYNVFMSNGGGGGFKIVSGEALPETFSLSNNYPNPFNPTTQIKFELPESAEVTVKVYNVMGQEVVTLVNTQMKAGFHNTTFKADNLASGLYIARLTAVGSSGEQFTQEIKMQLIK